MNISNKGNNGTISVVVDFQKHVSSKARLKKRCVGCSYLFKPKNNHDRFCETCLDGIKQYINTEVNKEMISAWGGYQ